MSKIQVKFKNYKLLENEIMELNHGFLYLIKGKGNLGKTTRISGLSSLLLAKDDTMIPLTHGKEEGSIELTGWTNEKGEKISVKRSMRSDSKDIYSMEINGKKAKSVTEIRNAFDHTDFDVVEFVKNSTLQEGRTKQRELILNLLSVEDKTSFFDFEDAEKEASDKRKLSKKDLASAKTLLKNNTLDEKEIILFSQKKAAAKMLKELESEVAETSLIEEKVKNINKSIISINNSLNQAKDGLDDDFVVMLEEVRAKIEEKYLADIESLPKIDEASLTLKQSRIEKGAKILDDIKVIEIKKSKFDDYTIEVAKLNKIVEADEASVAKIKEEKNQFMTTVDLPVDNLIIGSREEGLFYNLDGNVLPFNEKQLSKTLIHRISIQIMANLNKKSKVVVLGDASLFDDDFKQEVANYAKEKGLLVIADQVTNDEEVYIEMVEGNDEAIKTTTKSEPKTKVATKPEKEIIKDVAKINKEEGPLLF